MPIAISNVTRRVVYSASGTGPYAFTFEILTNTDIAVFKDDTLLTLTTDYTVTIAANGTGSITLVASPTGATQIAIVGNRTIQRTTDFVTGGDFFANTVNDEMDQQTIFAQQNAEGLQRALSAPQTDPTTINMTLPRSSIRAGKVLSFDSSGNPSATEFIGSNRGNWASGTLYFVRDIIKDTTNSNIWQVTVQHTSSGSLPIGTNADAAKFTLLVDAAAAGTSATNAATSATAAAASASAASTSATAASGSASTASTQASNASTSASNASTSASAASGSASTASTQATNAGTSATAAATSATNASNSATSASTSASNASSSASAASTSASNASTSATNASNSASTATTQASNASTSASTASTQATNAASSATAAAASAAAAAASFDAFDDIYLGAKASNPTVDNDGNALTTGDQYFNTVANELRVWNGSAWQTASTVGGTVNSINVTGLATLATGAILNTPASVTLSNASGLPLTTGVTGTLPTANGGTNLTSFTSGGVVYASSTSALATGSALKFDGTAALNITGAGSSTNGGGPAFGVLSNSTADQYYMRLNASKQLTFYGYDQSNSAFGWVSLGLADGAKWAFYAGGSEGMRLTSTLLYTASTVNIAIGASSGTAGSRLTIQESATNPTALSLINRNSTQTWKIAVDAAAVDDKILAFIDNATATVRLSLTDTGNLGLGVTPSAWNSSYKAIQLGSGGSVSGHTSTSLPWLFLGSNNYIDNVSGGTSRYIQNGYAPRYLIRGDDGSHVFYTSPSGTAGNPITFTQAMTLDADGDLGIGTSSPGERLDVVGSARVLRNTGATNTGDQNSIIAGATTTGAYASSYGAGLQFQITNSSGGYSGSRIVSRLNADNNTANLVFQARNYGFADSMTLDASGNLLVGTTTATQKLTVSGSIGATGAFIPYNGATIVGYIGNGSSLTTATDLAIRCDTGNIVFGFSGTERVRISASGGLSVGTNTDAGVNNLIVNGTGRFGTTVGVGAATPSTSGAGITFPATASDSTSANTLDDYEEGTWTPNQGGSLTVVGTFSSSGTYTKIGRMVYCALRVAGSTSIAFNAGATICTNLPFATNTSTSIQQPGVAINDATSAGIVALAYNLTVFTPYGMAATSAVNFNFAYHV